MLKVNKYSIIFSFAFIFNIFFDKKESMEKNKGKAIFIITKKILCNYIISIIFISLLSKSMIKSTESYITMKIPKGDNAIYCLHRYNYFTYDVGGGWYYKNRYDSNFNYPDEIYINEIKQDTVQNIYTFNKTINTVKLVWNNPINDCRSMFYGCSSIIEIDLSHFILSRVTMMNAMFYGCSSLKKFNISFQSSNVNNMLYMFHGCNSLISLDLSTLKTAKIKNSGYMFCHCNSLESLNLSNFDLSIVTYIGYMFYNCQALRLVHLNNSVLSGSFNSFRIFDYISNNLHICTQDENWKNLLNANYFYVNCKDNENNNIEYRCYKNNINLIYNRYICDICDYNYYQKIDD